MLLNCLLMTSPTYTGIYALGIVSSYAWILFHIGTLSVKLKPVIIVLGGGGGVGTQILVLYIWVTRGFQNIP